MSNTEEKWTDEEQQQMLNYFDVMYAFLDKKVRAKGVFAFKTFLPSETLVKVAEAYEAEGPMWWEGYHSGFGKEMRNLLREQGIGDEDVPMGNLDDYWVQILEEAVGIRGPGNETLRGIVNIATECDDCHVALATFSEADDSVVGYKLFRECSQCQKRFDFTHQQIKRQGAVEEPPVAPMDEPVSSSATIIHTNDSDLLIVKCDCQSHELQVESPDHDPFVQISLWRYGNGAEKWPWSVRLKSIWSILTKGHATADHIILAKSRLPEVIHFLQKASDKNKVQNEHD